MEVLADPTQWAEQHFGTAELGDPRRTRRLVAAAAAIARFPEKPFPQIFDWNALRGFYGLCHRPEATLTAVMRPHWQQTWQAMHREPLVLIVHDTCELDYSSHRHLRGIGQIGNEHGRGLLQHNSLALVPQPRRVLGLAFQQLHVRQPAPVGESTYQRKRRPRESHLWLEGFRAPGPPPEGCCWVDVGDRGADDYEGLRTCRDIGHHFLVRANQDRLVFVTAQQDRPQYLLQYARSLPSQGSDVVDIPGRGGRPPRTAQVTLAAAPIWIPPAKGTPQAKAKPVLAAWVLRIWEPQPPAGISEPLEWILLCSVSTTTLAELKERRDWYCCRWLVEMYHHIEKSGCSEEARRFETADRMETCLAILSIVAVRVFQLRCALDHQAEAPAEQVGTQEEIRLIRQYLEHPPKRFTVRDFVRGVARLGGFLGRKGDGEPGVQALWRGYQRLQDMLLGLQLHTSATKDLEGG